MICVVFFLTQAADSCFFFFFFKLVKSKSAVSDRHQPEEGQRKREVDRCLDFTSFKRRSIEKQVVPLPNYPPASSTPLTPCYQREIKYPRVEICRPLELLQTLRISTLNCVPFQSLEALFSVLSIGLKCFLKK